MLAQRLDPIDAYRQRVTGGTPIYRQSRKRRGMSLHASFVAQAAELFPGANILENIPRIESREVECHENA